jgi:formate dehydrogenase maturation protein FdhE
MSTVSEAHEQLLVALLYDEGLPEELAQARALLSSDPAFRAEYEKMLDTRSLLGDWPNVANVPRLVYVTEPMGFFTRVRRWVDEMGAYGLRSLLRPAAGLVAATAVLVVAFTVPAASLSERDMDAMKSAQPISRDELNSGLAEMAGYLEQLLSETRKEDRQIVMAALEERLNQRDALLSQTMIAAIDNAFSQLETRHTQEMAAVLGSIQDLRYLTAT